MKKLTTTMMQETLNKQDGRLTVGLDLGDRSSFYCVLDETGDVLLEQKVSTTPKAIKEIATSCSFSKMRPSTRKTACLCQHPEAASIAPNAQVITSCCFPTLASRTPALTRPATSQGRRTCSQSHRGEASACSNQYSLRPAEGRQHNAPAQQVHCDSRREAVLERGGEAARVQDLQIHERSHRHRGQ